MANQLDEVTGPTEEQGRDTHVIAKQIPIKVGWGSTFFEVALWCMLIIPGAVFFGKKIQAQNYFRGLEQKIQSDASTIDNYIEQRVVILTNLAKLLDKAIDLDKDTMTKVAAYRAGTSLQKEETRSDVNESINSMFGKVNIAMEQYPELKAHEEIKEAVQENSYLQKEITAAREVYNDDVNTWNRDVQQWPVKMIVAARAGYTTRIPFSTSQAVKVKAKEVFF